MKKLNVVNLIAWISIVVVTTLFILVLTGCGSSRNYITHPTGIVTDAGTDWVEVCFKVVSGGPSEFGCNKFYLPNHNYKIGETYP